MREKSGINCDKHQLHKLILEIKPSEYPEDSLSNNAVDNHANSQDVLYCESSSNDIEMDKIFKKIEQFTSRVRPVLEEKINDVTNEIFKSSKKGQSYELLAKNKVELEKHLSILIKYSEPEAKLRYDVQEHKAHLEELINKEREMIE